MVGDTGILMDVPSGKCLHDEVENHLVQWVTNFLWQCSIAMFTYQRVDLTLTTIQVRVMNIDIISCFDMQATFGGSPSRFGLGVFCSRAFQTIVHKIKRVQQNNISKKVNLLYKYISQVYKS